MVPEKKVKLKTTKSDGFHPVVPKWSKIVKCVVMIY